MTTITKESYLSLNTIIMYYVCCYRIKQTIKLCSLHAFNLINHFIQVDAFCSEVVVFCLRWWRHKT